MSRRYIKRKRSESGNIIRSLKQAGFTVDVEYGRLFKHESDKSKDLALTRQEFHDQITHAEFRSYKLVNNGGYTKVSISKDGQTWNGKYNVIRGNQFEKRVGLEAALTDALNKKKLSDDLKVDDSDSNILGL